MARISDDTKQLILAQTDIVDLINSYVPLKRAGSQFRANCPFHNEKTPSFYVNPAMQRFKCFGCGEGGDAIGFLMKHQNLPYPDAIRTLAQRSGITIVEENEDPEAEKRRRSASRLKELHNKSARHFHELLLTSPDAQHARNYLKSRGYGKDMARRWLVGWAPANPREFLTWAKQEHFTGRELCDSGLASLKDESNPRAGLYLRFRDRLMFPIHNDYGDIIAYSARQLDSNPNTGKYINSPETSLFKKSKVFFGLDKAKRPIGKKNYALLCEGQIDVIACHEAGFDNTIAAMGTASTPEHARLLKRFTDTVILCADGDPAGHKSLGRAFENLAEVGIEVKVAPLPEKEDPDSLIKTHGPESFQTLLDNASDFFDYQIDFAQKNTDFSQPLTRSRLANALAAWLKKIPDPVTRDTLLNHLATRLQIGIPEFRQTLANVREQPAYRSQDDEPETLPPLPIEPALLLLCQLGLQSPDVQDWLCDQTETLLEHTSSLNGHELLVKILGTRPDPDNPAEINAFLSSLPLNAQSPLVSALEHPLPDSPLEEAARSLTFLARRSLQQRLDQIASQLNSPNLPPDEITHLLNEAQELRDLLNDTNKS